MDFGSGLPVPPLPFRARPVASAPMDFTVSDVPINIPPRDKPPSVLKLPFEASRIGASVAHVKLARMWPNDPAMQQLLTAIIQITQELKLDAVITVPATVAIAGSCVRLAGFLLESALKPGKIACCGNTLFNLLLPVRQIALENLQKGGWEEASPLPQSVLDHWWQVAKLQPQNIPDSLDTATEKAVCAAIVVFWIKLLLLATYTSALKHDVTFLSLTMVQLGMSRDTAEDYPSRNAGVDMAAVRRHNRAVELYASLKCSMTPDLDTTLLFPQPQQESPKPHPRLSFADNQAGDFLRDREYETIARILDADSWYHNPNLLRIVAEQFICGRRQPHLSDTLLAHLNFRPCRIRDSLPQGALAPTSIAEKGKTEIELQIVAIDAAGREWPLVVTMKDGRGTLVLVAENHDQPHIYGKFRKIDIIDFAVSSQGGFAGKSRDALAYFHHGVLREFAPHLSSTQETALRYMRLAAEQCKMYSDELVIDSKKGQLLNATMDKSDQPAHLGYSLGSLRELNEPFTRDSFSMRSSLNTSSGVNVEQALVTWRVQEFERLAIQAQPFLDYARRGLSRYNESHTVELRRRFQINFVDSALKANGIPLLPIVLVELIADYHIVESLPYITPEDQKQLINTSLVVDPASM